jgi:hypothetical protein
LLREPLVHFLGLGLALFVLHALVAPADQGEGRIVVSAQIVSSLAEQHEKLFGSPPSAQELSALVDARVQDEMLYREGVAMGLDKDDDVIKRRVRQNYELIAEGEDSAAGATDADLEAYLKANRDRFRAPPVVSFQQVVVPLSGTDAVIEARITAMKSALTNGAAPDTLGGPSLLPTDVPATSLDLVARDFGSRFAQSLGSAPVGKWSGPIRSAYGVHLVRLDSRAPSALPPLAEIRAKVAREWENDRRTKARNARMAELRQSYDVVIEELPAKQVK